jgi:hypothetical protein
MEKTFGVSYEAQKQANQVKVQEYSAFDEVMERITNNMFKAILFGGIPFFLWVMFQALLKF